MILYKYLPCDEFTFKSLAVSGLWCHYPEKMNDPFECLAGVQRKSSDEEISRFIEYGMRSQNDRVKMLAMHGREAIDEHFQQVRRRMISDYAFCSLSTKYDDILMWSHYANSHRGMVLGIEIDPEELGHHLQQVEYHDNLPQVDLTKFAQFMENEDEHLGEFFKDISIKSKHWAYESEWRIWQRKPGYFVFRPEQVKEVYFGVSCDDDTKRVVLEILNHLDRDKFGFGLMEMSHDPIKLFV